METDQLSQKQQSLNYDSSDDDKNEETDSDNNSRYSRSFVDLDEEENVNTSNYKSFSPAPRKDTRYGVSNTSIQKSIFAQFY